MDAVTLAAERIVKLPPVQGRRELLTVLNASNEAERGSRAHELALSFNAHLCTKIREICESRNIRSPWAV